MRRCAAWMVLVLGGAVSTATARETPDLGVILNDDGDYSFVGPTPEDSAAGVRSSVDALAGTPVKTLVYCVGAGSDVLYYPTKVASVWGWRETEQDREHADPTPQQRNWRTRVLKIKEGMAAGVDPIRIAGERAKEHGLYFFPSVRMNDSHFMFDPHNYPLTGRFWMEHQELRIGASGESPIASQPKYANLLDFSHDAVREYRLAIITEVLDRYGDILDGIELDFNRVQVFFPRGEAEAKAHLITELVAEVRRKLDALGEQNGRDYYLMARIPPTPANCRWAGLDLEAWMRDRLVDVISPAQLMTLAHDMPIDAFVAMAESAGCRVYPSLYPRTNFSWPYDVTPTEARYAQPAERSVTPELMRAAASNYWRMGADGFYLFNFHHEGQGRRPYPDASYRMLRDLASPATLTDADLLYAITPGYYLDHEDTYQNRKQIPASIAFGKTATFTIQLGDEVRDAQRRFAEHVGLRLGFRDLPEGATVTVRVNGVPLTPPDDGVALIAVTGKGPKTAPATFWQAEIPPDVPLLPGGNAIEVTVASPSGESSEASSARLVEVRLALQYDRPFLDLLFEPGEDGE